MSQHLTPTPDTWSTRHLTPNPWVAARYGPRPWTCTEATVPSGSAARGAAPDRGSGHDSGSRILGTGMGANPQAPGDSRSPSGDGTGTHSHWRISGKRAAANFVREAALFLPPDDHILDLAPTACALLGVAPPPEMIGKCLIEPTTAR